MLKLSSTGRLTACIYAKSFAANSELTTIELLRSCCLPILLYAIESLVPRASDINSLNNCQNTAKIFRVSFGNGVDFIRQMTGLISLRIGPISCRKTFNIF